MIKLTIGGAYGEQSARQRTWKAIATACYLNPGGSYEGLHVKACRANSK